MDKNLKALKDIEADLLSQLTMNPIFIQLESIRRTIATFEPNGHKNGIEIPSLIKSAVKTEYDPENFTWKERVVFVISKLGSAAFSEIVKEIHHLEPDKEKVFLDKRIGVTLSQLKKKGDIDVRREGRKGVYYIK